MRNSRRLLIAGGLFLVAALAGGFMLANQGVDIRIDEAKIRQAVEAKLPLEGSKAGIAWTVSGAEATILPDGRIGLDATLVAGAAGKDVNFTVSGSGVPVYRDGAFHVGGLSLTDIGYLPDTDQSLSGRLFGAVAGTGWGQEMEAKALAEGTSLIGAYLDHTPVYRLPSDIKGTMLKLAIREVSVSGDALVVNLDPLGAIAKILLAVVLSLSFLAGMVVVVLKHPEALLGFAVLGALGN